MVRSGGEGELPEAEVVLIDAATQREAPERPPRRSSARRLGVLLASVALFAFGVVVGRGTITLETGVAQPAPTTTGTSAPSSPDPSATGTSTSPPSAPSTSTSSTTSATPRPNRRDLESAIGGLGQAQAFTAIGNQLFLLTPGVLYRLSQTDDGAITVDLMSSLGLPFGDPTYPSPWELLSDGTALWLVAPAVQGRMYRVSTPTLGGLTDLVPRRIDTTDVAALNGVLYQNTASGIFAVTESGDNEEPVARGGTAMAADPTRDRLLVLNNDGAWVVHAYVPGQLQPVTTSESLPFVPSGIAVADGTIWITGIRPADGFPALVPLNPRTLKVGISSAIGNQLTSAPEIVAAGHNLWVRSQDTGPELWCVDALTGSIAQHWTSLPGIVATSGDRAYIADGSLVGEIALNKACSG